MLLVVVANNNPITPFKNMATKLCKKYMNSWLEVQEMNPSASTGIGKEPVKVIPSCTICLIQPWHAKWKTHSKNETKRSSKMGVHDADALGSSITLYYYLLSIMTIIYYLLSIIIYYSSLLLEVDRYVFHTSCQLKPRNHLQSPMGSNREAICVAISYPDVGSQWRNLVTNETSLEIFGSKEIPYSTQLRLQQLPIVLLEVHKCIVFKFKQFRIFQETSHGISHEFRRQSASSTKVPRAYRC